MKNQYLISKYKGVKVLITGHTGFKGSWLTLWLNQLGANVSGISLGPVSELNHFDLLDLEVENYFLDINNAKSLDEAFEKIKPDIVFHLAAQALVRYSYTNPVETYQTNVIGTLNVLEAARKHSVKSVVCITTDKCYENKEWVWGYREIDPIGGHDPYSSSKGCAELLISSYRNSFFHLDHYGKTHSTLIASARAGNVIGGGDWAQDRLIPDIVKPSVNNQKLQIRNLNSIRPWQHVLDPLYGYLLLGAKLLEGDKKFADSWNFGPEYESCVSVDSILKKAKLFWPGLNIESCHNDKNPHEANILILDCSKAKRELNWFPVWNIESTVNETFKWYQNYYETGKLISSSQLEVFCKSL